ncbi:MAG: hypothetical protein RMK18_09755 [Armatimonadota bacterium]|nr:hypothetical protein [Armatimonadota bacterium]MDW8026128.1 hypothetical protein [Armatimonadota bacterium]
MRIVIAMYALTLTLPAMAQVKKIEPLHQIAQSISPIGGLCFIIIICFILGAWVSLISALLQRWVQQKMRVISEKGTYAFLLGIILTFFITIIGVLFGAASRDFPPAGIIALLSAFTLWSALALGLVPVSWVIGGKIAKTMGIERDDLSTALLGAFTLFLICFVPIVGWTFALYWAIVAVGLWVTRA